MNSCPWCWLGKAKVFKRTKNSVYVHCDRGCGYRVKLTFDEYKEKIKRVSKQKEYGHRSQSSTNGLQGGVSIT